jgi:pimeloyl-ACP methyl ester carboxylesterase
MTEITERVAHANGLELHVLEAGERGAPLVLLSHGFPEGAWSWRHQLPALAAAGYHVVAPYQRGYGRSPNPHDVGFYAVRHLVHDLVGLIDDAAEEQAVIVGHDWGAMITWEMARLCPERVRAVVGVSVPFVQWPAPPTQLFKMLFTDRFFYMLYFQQVGPPETELEADIRHTMATFLWNGSSAGFRPPQAELPAMAGTGLLTHAAPAPPLPWTWLTEADLQRYVDDFTHSGFFGPVSYYRNLDANYELVKDIPAARVSMPAYFIGGTHDMVNLMDPGGIERMRSTLPDFRGATVLDGVGHWTQQENPPAFNDALISFLRSLDTA